MPHPDQTENAQVETHDGRRSGLVVSVRLKPSEADALTALAEREGRTLAETLRIALRDMANRPRNPELRLRTSGGGSPAREYEPTR